ncbi:unnamed protein product [Symbiodinium necroappetens]|uniref:Uncharacterized protein n=1 Tax=Symbiodinium necroappetens TaxID=1628268 RepID=A0A813CIL7_9DINO|nr:unnamed protein product [Symbiodinium necroappetens]
MRQKRKSEGKVKRQRAASWAAAFIKMGAFRAGDAVDLEADNFDDIDDEKLMAQLQQGLMKAVQSRSARMLSLLKTSPLPEPPFLDSVVIDVFPVGSAFFWAGSGEVRDLFAFRTGVGLRDRFGWRGVGQKRPGSGGRSRRGSGRVPVRVPVRVRFRQH